MIPNPAKNLTDSELASEIERRLRTRADDLWRADERNQELEDQVEAWDKKSLLLLHIGSVVQVFEELRGVHPQSGDAWREIAQRRLNDELEALAREWREHG